MEIDNRSTPQIALSSLFMHRFPTFFLENVVLEISNSAKQNYEKIFITVPVRQVLRSDVNHTGAKSDWY